MKRGLIVAALAAASVILPVTPAYAAVTGTTSAPSQVLYPDCRNIQINYSLQISGDTRYWNLEIDVLEPDGTIDGGAYLASSIGDPPQGTFDYFVCSSQMPGTYTVRGRGEFATSSSSSIYQPYSLPDSTFQVRLANTKTSIKKRSGSFIVAVKDERPNGYFPTAYADLYFEQFRNGRWSRIPRSTSTTDDRGRAPFRINRTGPTLKLRAVTRPGNNYSGSTSRPITLRP